MTNDGSPLMLDARLAAEWRGENSSRADDVSENDGSETTRLSLRPSLLLRTPSCNEASADAAMLGAERTDAGEGGGLKSREGGDALMGADRIPPVRRMWLADMGER